MAEIKTLSVRRHCYDNLPTFSSWKACSDSFNRIPARPKRLRTPECRELLPSTSSLPSIHVHIPKCRCSQTETEHQLQDGLLAAKISSLSKTLPTATTRPPAKPTPSRLRISQSKRSGSATTSSTPRVLSTLTRLFSTPAQSPSAPLQADLCLAAASLDIDKVARYLVPGQNACHHHSILPVNAPNHLGFTPLMAAVRSPVSRVRPKSQVEMVRFLVDCCGADVNAERVDRVTGVGESVLAMACVGGLREVVRLLVGRGAEVDRRLPLGSGLGMGGMGKGSRAVVVRERGQTALHVAVLAGRAECVEVLVKEGKADVNATFDAAAFVGRELAGLEKGFGGLRGRARSLSRDRRERSMRHPVSALHLARGSYACAQILLRGGADVTARDGYGRTPLYWAAESGNVDVVRLLINAGADLRVAADDGSTLLNAAVVSLKHGKGNDGPIELVRLLLENCAEAGVRDQSGGNLRHSWLGSEK